MVKGFVFFLILFTPSYNTALKQVYDYNKFHLSTVIYCTLLHPCATMCTMETTINKIPKRIYLTITEEQYIKIKAAAGQIPMSSYIRGKVFSVDSQAFNDTDYKGWIELLSQIPDRDKLLKRLISDAKEMRSGDTKQLFLNKLYQYGF